MDNNNTNNNKNRASFSEDANNKGSTSENQWQENPRDQTKKDRSRDTDSNGNRPPKKHKHSLDKNNITLRHEQTIVHPIQQAAQFPAYNYKSTDHLYVDSNRHTLSRMSYNMMASVNTPWPVNSYENMAMNQHQPAVNQAAIPMTTGLEMVQSTSANMNPYAYIGIPGENMYGVVGMGNYCQYGGVPPQENIFFPSIKEIIQFASCVLYSPIPSAPRPPIRKRPLGCKTVFVGGLPKKITVDIIKEIFEGCGIVETIRMSNKNFCYIRFTDELYVNNAFYFSGYKLKIENKDEAPFTGRLHVDYANTRDDQYDYECKHRALQRQAHHLEQDYYRPPTPPVVHYTDHEALLISEKLKNEETFTQAASILISWLEKGECTKKNASSFFSMIQNTHMRKFQLDKVKFQDQLNKAKKKKQLEGIIYQFTEIEKIYKAASLQKCWDQFTKAQRKNIEMWKKQTEELKNAHLEEVINERQDEEMELSEDENDSSNKRDADVEQIKKQYEEVIHRYQEEVDSLRCQLEAAQNEISDHKYKMASMKQDLEDSKTELEHQAHLASLSNGISEKEVHIMSLI